jgi:cytochrome P450
MDKLTDRPTFSGDPYNDDLLRNPYDAYRTIRDLGTAVWLPKRDLFAIGRYDDVRAALRADAILVSGRGVAANDAVNSRPARITLTSDGEIHLRRRQVLIQPVTPAPLKALRPQLEAEADRLVEQTATGKEFDAVADFAAYLPVSVVAELVGLDDKGRKNMLRWASAAFNALGVMNVRGMAAMPDLLDLGRYIQTIQRLDVTPGGWADKLFESSERGDLSPEEAKAMVIDYVGPALDTTILATAHMIWLLGTHPDAFATLRAEPQLIPSVVNECVRLASPIRSFTRYVVEDYQVGEATIPKGSRALILFASANRDERHYDDPDKFDVRRNPRDHVGWGHGAHTCVGMHLARLEMEILLAALVRRVARITVGEPTFIMNNVLQGHERLPATFHADTP